MTEVKLMNDFEIKELPLGLEHKFVRLGETVEVDGALEISGYASLFGLQDQGGDVVLKGAYETSLKALKAKGCSVKMLWQHDPAQPIGVWDEVREDTRGLYVKGRLLLDIEKGREAAALIEAGAIDGLSIGYRTVRSQMGRAEKSGPQKDGKSVRLLSELELWEVSLVTFPMLPEARVGADVKGDTPFKADTMMRDLAQALQSARKQLAD
jgi:HK97 family phage prohead protease